MSRRVRSETAAPYNITALDTIPDYLPAKLNEAERAIVAHALRIVTKAAERGPAFTEPKAVMDFCRLHLADLEHEVFGVLFLDTRHRLIAYRVLFRGTVDGSEVHPREVVKEAMACNAAACVFTHNHPSGALDPSTADRVVTKRLKEALALVDVRVLDHIIVAGGSAVSFAREGWL